jgi:glycine/D-amino acid oxidase-like deaminating enzyme/nitrite reductase/ring-hydroxylating ferredoxin subunit
MDSLSGKPTSYWIDSTSTGNFSSLESNLSVDVAIVGAGIAGLTAATLLKKAGKTVAVLESREVATGTSGHTTAKITSLHQLIYATLIDKVGEDKARIYGDSQQAAIEQVARLVAQEQIDCNFERKSAYTFAESEENLKKIEDEVEAALRLGLPASFVRETSLPFPISGAIRFDNQAQFHPRKYLLALAKMLPGNGSYVFENTRVQNVKEGSPCEVISDRGTLSAKKVLVTTHLPILDQGLFFAKSYPQTSYLIAAPIEDSKAPDGMFIGVEEGYRSVRTTPSPEGTLLLIGGEGHKTGSVSDTEECYLKLETYIRDRFGVESVKYRWSTHDMKSMDKLPYIGKLTPLSDCIYVATGFSLWGMSNGTLSGMILSDLVLENENPWAHLYDATRITPFLSAESLKNNLDVGKHWVGDRLKGSSSSTLAELANGEGKLVNVDGDKIAAYRDEEGTLHTCSAVCPHLGCIVNWNSAEKSWDCPCHGAQYTGEGKLFHGPAVKDLKPKNVEV